jgi:ferredoxin/coenzyme F420-reducing hydrogenase delta subunit
MHRTTPTPGPASWRVLARLDSWANRLYGARWNPLYHSGAIVVALLLVLLATGLYLLVFYRLGAPWASVARITEQAWLGRWIRGLHRFASDAVVVAAAVHAFRMYAQRRSWGPRALAWVSGLLLLAVIFVCGWTGYVMVWDVQAQLLAVEGARFLDVLPIFSEPIGRTFVGERPLPSAFFFLNLFAHIALPVGLILLLWLHVSRVARPVLLPPRLLLWGLVGALALLAVLWPVGMAPEADLFRLPDRVPLDLFYAFWLPLTRRLPAWSVWVVGGALALALLLVPLWTRPRVEARPAKSVVNERACTGCEQCMLDCPFDAITMVQRTDGRDGMVARVDPDRCVGCGICIGSCAPMAVGPPGRTGRDQLALVRAFVERERPGARDVVVIACEWSAARHDGALDGVLLVSLPCAGNVHTSSIEALLRGGAGGVLVAACPTRDCRSREGPRWLDQRVWHGREAELQERVDRRRVRIVEAAAAEPGVLAAALRAFRDDVAALAASDDDDDAADLIRLCRVRGERVRDEGPDLEEAS